MLTPDEIAELKRDMNTAKAAGCVLNGVIVPHMAALISAAERVGELEAIVARLPKTADGVVVVPPMLLFYTNYGGEIVPIQADCIDLFAGGWLARSWNGQHSKCRAITQCYSTRHAAALAKGDDHA